jgi:hypothetical protein
VGKIGFHFLEVKDFQKVVLYLTMSSANNDKVASFHDLYFFKSQPS